MNRLQLIPATLAFLMVAPIACDDTTWQHGPAKVTNVHPAACPWALKRSYVADVRQVRVGEPRYLLYFLGDASPDPVPGYKEALLSLGPNVKIPLSEEQVALYGLPPLLEVDAVAGAVAEVPWARWSECTGPALSSLGRFGSMPGPVEKSQNLRSIRLRGTPLHTAAPYALGIEAPPGLAKGLALFSAFGPTETLSGVAAPDLVVPLGDVVVEWLKGDVANTRRDAAHRLSGSGVATYDVRRARGRAGAWTPDGRCYLLTVGDKLWIVPNPEFETVASSSEP